MDWRYILHLSSCVLGLLVGLCYFYQVLYLFLPFFQKEAAHQPEKLHRYAVLIAARNEYVAGAKKEVEKMLRQAELDAKTIVSESEVLQQARQKANDIVRRAEDRSRELYRVANTYTEDALRRTEEAIQSALAEVQNSRTQFRAASQEQMQAAQDHLRQKGAE